MRVRLAVSFLALVACASPEVREERVVVRWQDSVPPPPRVTAFAAAPALIGIVVAIDSIEHGWLVVNVKGVAPGDSAESRASLDNRRLSDTAWLPVSPGTRYLISGQLVTTSVPARASPWSNGLEVTTPKAPAKAPRPPVRLVAAAASPYAIRLTWGDRSSDEYGFAIERVGADGLTFERVALVQANRTSWMYAGLSPGESATFRVLSFSSAGASAPSAVATAATHADVARAPSIDRTGEKPDSVAACLAPNDDLSRADAATEEAQPRLYRSLPFGSHQVDMRVYLCGNANCTVTLYATYRGCKREIGDLFFVPGDSASPGWDVRATDRDGWPVIVTTSHMSYSSFGVQTYQLLRGRYRGVDSYLHCGALRDVAWTGRGSDSSLDDADPRIVALQLLRPPFNDCQLDDRR